MSGPPVVTARQLNRATLERQMLVQRRYREIPDAVRELAALQAQEPASPYLALWNRLSGFASADLDRAFGSGAVVKATLIRMTLHAVERHDHAAYYPAIRERIRAGRVGDPRFTVDGLTGEQADALIPALCAYTRRQARSEKEIRAHLADQLGRDDAAGVWWALRTYAPLRHAPAGAPWTFRTGVPASFRAAGPQWQQTTAHDGAVLLATRYLNAFGPATVADLAGFTGLTRTAARGAIEQAGPVRLTGPGEQQLYDVAGRGLPDPDLPGPARLLPMWDSTLLAYADRSRILPSAYRPEVIRRNGNVLPTVLVDGRVAGVWRVLGDQVEVSAFARLPRPVWAELTVEAAALLDLVRERDPALYGAYHHWWARGIPAEQVRSLP